MNKKDFIIGLVLVLLGVIFRLMPHPANFTPIIAIALFSGAYFPSKLFKSITPLLAMLISDAFIGFYQGIEITYLAILISVFIGTFLNIQKFQFIPTIFASLSSSFAFFLITNFAVWLGSGMYEISWNGLTQCYIMAIPFYQNALVGDVLYTIFFFGSYHLYHRSLNLKTTI